MAAPSCEQTLARVIRWLERYSKAKGADGYAKGFSACARMALIEIKAGAKADAERESC